MKDCQKKPVQCTLQVVGASRDPRLQEGDILCAVDGRGVIGVVRRAALSEHEKGKKSWSDRQTKRCRRTVQEKEMANLKEKES